MTSILSASAAVLLAGALLSAAAPGTAPQPNAAQLPQPPAATTPLPQGPYLSSCRAPRMVAGALVALCDQGNGAWHQAQLADAARCTSSVVNINGTLSCTMKAQSGASAAPQSSGPAPAAPAGQSPGAGPNPTAAPPASGPAPLLPPASGTAPGRPS
jgi:hypothetical protein